jgi:hypothetical protein
MVEETYVGWEKTQRWLNFTRQLLGIPTQCSKYMVMFMYMSCDNMHVTMCTTVHGPSCIMRPDWSTDVDLQMASWPLAPSRCKATCRRSPHAG